MNIVNNNQSKKCDFGACGSAAQYSITFDNCSSAANIEICHSCLKKLTKLAKRVLYVKD